MTRAVVPDRGLVCGDDVARLAAALYGDVDWKEARGLLHVAAVARDPGVGLLNIRLGEHAPHGALDRRVLGLARARAEAIVTSGRNLRSEPDLRHMCGTTPAEEDAFESWRAQTLAIDRPTSSIVWTRGDGLPAQHPLLSGEGPCRVVTSQAAAPALARAHPTLRVDGRDVSDLSSLASRLFAEGVRTLLVECGPSTSRCLYDRGRPVPAEGQELLLSIFEGTLDPSARGEPFVEEDAIVARLGPPVSDIEACDEGATWRFRRYRR